MDTSAVQAPVHRAILVVDIEGSTTRTNPARAGLRSVLFALLDEAFRAGGITEEFRDPFVDRGDGALCLVRPVDEVPKTVLLARVVPALTELLARHGDQDPELAFRLRVSVHAGEVHYDAHGPYGEDIDIACRLLDAPDLRRRLRASSGPLALVVSNAIHRSVVRHGYAGIDRSSFAHAFRVRVGGQRTRGWVRTTDAVRPGAGLIA
ncbi:hypothetical protein [Amycolatopsis echigonensis]|uniref:Guanylate cyclase domain-containing protein n=1 Tax=Amycolatopsis echigonensis TaxID=2576905 RepID=A0A8E1VVY1_9PSEU|nr:hypothetical protein [Amycolatopsis echigonensis]MBB2499206.1 hypothetical protein [Amycolatopsis echigonensis]